MSILDTNYASKSVSPTQKFTRSYFLSATTYIDSSAVQALKELHQEYKSRNIEVYSQTIYH